MSVEYVSRAAMQAARQLNEVHVGNQRSPRWFSHKVGRLQVMSRPGQGKVRGWRPRQSYAMQPMKADAGLSLFGMVAALFGMKPRAPRVTP